MQLNFILNMYQSMELSVIRIFFANVSAIRTIDTFTDNPHYDRLDLFCQAIKSLLLGMKCVFIHQDLQMIVLQLNT